MTKHNKKRNIGIIYELLLREISSSIVETKNQPSKKAVRIIKEHFKVGTELYKEFRLFNALVKTTASSPDVAHTILKEARDLACSINPVELDRQKSHLIQTINRSFEKNSFYSRWIPEYRMYATIQTLLNDWRDSSTGNISEHIDFRISRQAEFESKVKEWLLTEKVESTIEDHYDPTADSLVLKLMSEKVNDRYDALLNKEQKDILSSYIFFLDKRDETALEKKLAEVKVNTLNFLNRYLQNANNEILNEKSEMIRKDISSLPTTNIDDDAISKYLTVAHLYHALSEENV